MDICVVITFLFQILKCFASNDEAFINMVIQFENIFPDSNLNVVGLLSSDSVVAISFNTRKYLRYVNGSGELTNYFKDSCGTLNLIDLTITDDMPALLSDHMEQLHCNVWILPRTLIKQDGVTTSKSVFSHIYLYDITNLTTITIYELYATPIRFKTVESYLFDISTTNPADDLMASLITNNVLRRIETIKGLHLRVTTLPWSPFIIETSRPGEFEGVYIELFLYIQSVMKFEFSITLSNDGFWGAKDVDGTWNGMVGMTIRNETDLILAPLMLNKERNAVIDLSQHIYEDRVTINKKNLRGRRINLWSYSTIFRFELWMCLITLICVMVPILMLIGRQSWLETRNLFFNNCMTSFGLIATSFLQRGTFYQAHTLSSKLFYATLSLSSYMVFAYYTSDLIARMATSPQNLNLKSFEDVIANDLRVLVMPNTGEEIILKTSGEGTILNSIYSKIQEHPQNNLGDLEWIANELDNDEMAVQFGLATSFLNDPEMTSFNLIDSIPNQFVMGFQKNSGLKELFDYFLAKFRENGVLSHVITRWMPSKTESYGEAVDDYLVLGYSNIILPFMILIFSIPLAFLICSCEVVSWFGNFRKNDLPVHMENGNPQVKTEKLNHQEHEP